MKTDYIWITDNDTFEDAKNLIEFEFKDYNTIRTHSSLSFLPPDEFEKRWNESDEFRNDLKLSDCIYHYRLCSLIIDLDMNIAIIIKSMN